MDRWRGKVAIVTGPGSGIGAAIAERLVDEGLQVVGLEKNFKEAEDLAKKLSGRKGKLHPIETDITKEGDILKAFEWTLKNLGPVHILVNNAGIGQQTTLTDGNTAQWRKVFDTNVLGLCIATREAVKIMKDHKIDGHIIHIGSECGQGVPNIPGLNVYPASKHAVKALTETLRQEFNHLGLKIKVTEISPGTVATNIAKNNNIVITEEMAKFFKDAVVLQPEDLADAVYYTLSTPPHVQVHEIYVKPVGHPF